MGFSEKQLKIMKFPYTSHTALICDGAVRSGKTSIMSLSFVLWAMNKFSGKNFAICGKTVQSAERNIINPLLEIQYLQRQFTINYSRSTHLLTVSRGHKTNRFYLFGGKDESSFALIQGLTLAGVLLDEVALMPQSFVEQALARCSVDGSKFWFNCNPEHPEHWFHKEWVEKSSEKDALHLHFVMDDNPSLSPEIRKRYESLYSGVFYDRYIKGLWVVAEGRVYPLFTDNPDRFLMKKSTIGMDGQFFVSIDYGTVNPCSMGLWCVNSQQAVRIKENYFDSRREGRQKTDEEHYTALEKLTRGYYIRYIVVDPSAASFIECIRRHGKFVVIPAINDVLNGIRVTSDLLNSGKLLIHESCKDSIREFGLYRWDEKSPEDKPLKENDHAMDDIRYFCSTVLAREYRWTDWTRR